MIEVKGTYKGEAVTLGWDDGNLLGPLAVIDALVDAVVDASGRTLVAANGDRLHFSGLDMFQDPRVFVYSAFQALQNPSTDWEEIATLPEGTVP